MRFFGRIQTSLEPPTHNWIFDSQSPLGGDRYVYMLSCISWMIIAFAAHAAPPFAAQCQPSRDSVHGLVQLAQYVPPDSTGCSADSDMKKARESFHEKVASEKAKGQNVILSRDQFDRRTSNSVSYDFNGQKLAPGEWMYMMVPPDLMARGVNFAILGHRQNPATERGMVGKWDHEPGLTSVQVYDEVTGEWRYWAGSASGKYGAKFAEVGYSFEMENLYEWGRLGHRGVNGGSLSREALLGRYIRVTNVGTDPVELNEVSLKTVFPKADRQVTHKFSSIVEFGDQLSGAGYNYGGGQAHRGLWPNALALSGGGEQKPTLPAGWKFENGSLHIPLPAGQILTGVEMSGGDSHPDQIRNSDNGWGSKGGSRLSVTTMKGGVAVDRLLKNENVPPEGIMMAAPTHCGRVITEGESLVISAANDVTYLAGLRLSFKEAK